MYPCLPDRMSQRFAAQLALVDRLGLGLIAGVTGGRAIEGGPGVQHHNHQRLVAAQSIVLGGTTGDPTSIWMFSWDPRGILAGSAWYGRPLTKTESLPVTGPTWAELRGWPQMAKKSPRL